jgi:hypothetical protein
MIDYDMLVDTIEFIFNLIDAQQPECCFRFTLCVADQVYTGK